MIGQGSLTNMKEDLSVPEVSCGHCKSSIEAALLPLPGVRQAEVDVDVKQVAVDFDELITDRAAVVGAIEAAGYSVAS